MTVDDIKAGMSVTFEIIGSVYVSGDFNDVVLVSKTSYNEAIKLDPNIVSTMELLGYSNPSTKEYFVFERPTNSKRTVICSDWIIENTITLSTSYDLAFPVLNIKATDEKFIRDFFVKHGYKLGI